MTTGLQDKNMLLVKREFAYREKIKNKIASLIGMKKGQLRKQVDGV